MEAFYRAKLTLERIEPHTDANGYTRERATEVASVNVTGETPGDAMYQIHDHAGTLHDWHDQPAPIIDEAFQPLTPEEANQRINAAFSQLSKAAQGFLRKPPNEPGRPDDPATLADRMSGYAAEGPAICATCEGRGEVNGRPCSQCTRAGAVGPAGITYGQQ